MKNLKEQFQTFGLNMMISFLGSNCEKNLPKVIKWLEKSDVKKEYPNAFKNIRKVISDPKNDWNVVVKNVYEDLDLRTRQRLVKNFIVNSVIIGNRRRKKIGKKEDCNVPWAILLDPTSNCNLNCTGCWAAEYGKKLSLSTEILDRIITEGKELGIYMFIYSGGEPLLRKKDILALCKKHSDCTFLAFTNGTLIDEDFADEMQRVQNFVPAISIEGFEEDTDLRRGKGTYQAVIRAMQVLRERKLLFGISTCYTSQNVKEVGSEQFIDAMIAQGAKFCWYFMYMPVGKKAKLDLMVSAADRELMYHQVRRFRKEKPILMLDFWNDGEYIGGCIAGGRHYLHINANGDVEPCAFIHYANVNIKEVSLIEALKSPLFMEYRKYQPFNNNHLRPCPMIDNPEMLCRMIKYSNAHSTELAHPEGVDVLTAKCKDCANQWGETAERLWNSSH